MSYSISEVKSANILNEPLENGPVFINSKKRKFYDFVFIAAYICCLVIGPFPSMTKVASIGLALCIVISFFDENFYMYAALFLYMRYDMLIGDTPVFRVYSYLVVLKLLTVIFKTKFRVLYLPALFVFFLHSVFAVPKVASLRIGLNVIVDCALIYIILLQILSEKRLFRKFMYVFLLGGMASGIYGWTTKEASVDINIRGAGAHTVNRTFGILNDSNYAGLFYSLCVIISFVIKGIPKWARLVIGGTFLIILLQTASLSAILVLFVLSCFLIVLKFRAKSIIILSTLLIVAVTGLTIMLSVPQFKEVEMISGLLIRIKEKLSYIPRGRWDLLTTNRTAIWGRMINYFGKQSLWGKLIGGNVITFMVFDTALTKVACHNSYIQSIMNFGIIGTIMIYIPLFSVFGYRLNKHLNSKKGYEGEDVKIIQLIIAFAFIVFGMTVDFYIDWPFMMFYFI